MVQKNNINEVTTERGHQSFALSYQPASTIAKHLCATLGFTETEEWEDDKIVARLSLGSVDI